jgi:hypothetical protein
MLDNVCFGVGQGMPTLFTAPYQTNQQLTNFQKQQRARCTGVETQDPPCTCLNNVPNGYITNNVTCEVGCNTFDAGVRKLSAQSYYRINNNTLDTRLFVHSTLSSVSWQLGNRDVGMQAFARVANYRTLTSNKAVYVFWYITYVGGIFEARFEANTVGALEVRVFF